MTIGILITLLTRYLLVMLFLPFSALDKILNFGGAVKQAEQTVPGTTLPKIMILVGLTVEIGMSLCVVIGAADRMAAFILAGYCCVTAILWKQFWKPGDFWSGGKGRELFWDFLKNFSLAGGFLMITFGLDHGSATAFFHSPFSSTMPYGP